MNAVAIVPAQPRDLCAIILLEVSTATVVLAILEMGHIVMVSGGTTLCIGIKICTCWLTTK